MEDEEQTTRGITNLHVAALHGNKTELKRIIDSSGSPLEAKDQFGRTPLIYSVMGNDPQCVSLLLKEGARVDNSDNNGQTALHLAAHKGLHRCVKILLAVGALWHQKDVDGVTALHLAAHHPSPKCLLLILGYVQPGQIDVQDSKKQTALHWSARFCNAEHMRLLLRKYANVFIQDYEGKTPLHLVAGNKDLQALECVKILLEEAATLINWQDYEGRSALHLAVATGSTEVVDFLTSKDLCISPLDNMFRTPLHWAAVLGMQDKVQLLLDRGADYSSTDGNGATPLHYAAQRNDAVTVSTFLSRCYVQDKPDAEGLSALMWAAAKGATNVIRVMHEHGLDLNFKDKNGITALHAAASQGHISTMELLMDLGVSHDIKDSMSMTPLFHACDMGKAHAIQLLLERGASLKEADIDGRSALHWAALGSHSYVCQLLIQYECSPDVQDFFGRTPLHYASYRGYVNCMTVLLDKGANPNAVDNEGKTSLHWASCSGNLDAVEVLFSFSVFVNPFDHSDERCTPLDYAIRGEHTEVVDLLLKHGAMTSSKIQEIAARKIQDFFRRHRRKGTQSSALYKMVNTDVCEQNRKENLEEIGAVTKISHPCNFSCIHQPQIDSVCVNGVGMASCKRKQIYNIQSHDCCLVSSSSPQKLKCFKTVQGVKATESRRSFFDKSRPDMASKAAAVIQRAWKRHLHSKMMKQMQDRILTLFENEELRQKAEQEWQLCLQNIELLASEP